PEPKASELDAVLADFQTLPGQVSLIVVTDGGVLAAVNADTPLAVGSAFKLAILAALKDQVAAGMRSWGDVIVLEEQDVSLPTGILQNWPPGTPMTVQALATLMISISDNTATDALLRAAGRAAVERYATRNVPLLSTREAFVLKAAGNEDLLEAWRNADVAGRRALLAELARRPLPAVSDLSPEPTALDVEWYFTVGELANLMAYVHDLPFMSVNPGVADPGDWSYIAFKGGSEPGVLNYTTLVVSHSRTPYLVSATWNNPEQALGEVTFHTLYSGLPKPLRALAARWASALRRNAAPDRPGSPGNPAGPWAGDGRRAAVVQRLPGARRPHPPDRCSFTPLSKLAVPRTKVSRNCQSSWRTGIQIRCPGGIAMTGLRRVVLEPNSPWGSFAVLVTLAVATGATYKTGGTV